MTTDGNPPEPGRRGTPAVSPVAGSLTGLTRSFVRACPYRSSSLPGAPARPRRHQGAAGVTRAREDLVHTKVALTTSCARASALLPGPIDLFTHHQSDLARVPGALSEPDRRARTRRAASRDVPQASALPRRQDAGRAALKAQTRARGSRRRGRDERMRRAVVLALVTAWVRSFAQIKKLETQISHAVRAHPDGAISLSASSAVPNRWSAPPRCSRDRRLPCALPHR